MLLLLLLLLCGCRNTPMLLLQVLPGCQQRMPLCCILHAQLQQPVVCQLQQLLPSNTLREADSGVSQSAEAAGAARGTGASLLLPLLLCIARCF